MKKLVKIILCIAMCFSMLAAMGVAVSADERYPISPAYSSAVLTYRGGNEYYGSATMSISQTYTSFDLYWSTIGIDSDDTGSSSYGVIGFTNTVYSYPGLEVDWQWMSSYHGNGDQA